MSFEGAVKAILKGLRLRQGKGRNDRRWRDLHDRLEAEMIENRINTKKIDRAGEDKLGDATKALADTKVEVDMIIKADKKAFGAAERTDELYREYPEREELFDSEYWWGSDVSTWTLKADDIAAQSRKRG